ncbi:hypothetical protein MSPP1_000186 [Malassezia sp. CBS 17886]|nr:hypothetical protein MSPP1_000186 [Malassezia sp. CBS 17886]
MVKVTRALLSVCTLLLAGSASVDAIVYRPLRSNDYMRGNLLSRAGDASASNGTDDSPPFDIGKPTTDYPGVVAQNPMGPTNPKTPKMGTPVNQTSLSRLASLNSVDDWCTFGPKDNKKPLGDVEFEVVAYCTKPRNGARVIPDGTVTAAHFVKTPLYVQVMALGDFTKINFAPNDSGGELDPHGATNKGNPVGGNVTSNVSGKDVSYQEWMNYVGFNIMCFRVCTAGSDGAPPALECLHTLDTVGCQWVMPGNYQPDTFDSCEADAAYPPGVYITSGSTSSFQQYATGLWTDDKGKTKTYTNGDKSAKTPSAAQSQPSSSNCKPASSISNGIKSIIPSSSSKGSGSSGGGKKGNGGAAGGSSDNSSSGKNGSDGSENSSDKSSSDSSDGSQSGANTMVPSLYMMAAVSVSLLAGGIFL